MTHLGPYPLDSIITGDARELAQAIPDESVDLIFTDPPYHKRYLPFYGWLGQEARRVLKPDGFLLTYCGNAYKNQCIRQLDDSEMLFFWDYQTIDYPACMVWDRWTTAQTKSILAYRKTDGSKPRTTVLGLWRGTGQDKLYHAWGQDESTARYFVDCFTTLGQVVFDPFVGGGSTAAACYVIGRHWLGFEIDPDTAERARERVAMTQPPLVFPEPKQTRLDV